jgi:hypothetical protein
MLPKHLLQKQTYPTTVENGIPPASKRPLNLNKPRWTDPQKQLVLKIRRNNPTYGKAKITVILARHGQTLSESTVGRILTQLKAKGLVTLSGTAVRAKPKRNFQKGHAKPWQYKDYKRMALGEPIQIDHMTVRKNGITFKSFKAWERRSKAVLSQIMYSNAKSPSAKGFLEELIAYLPFFIRSIQVDGGSEFRDASEQACAHFESPRIVLPPRQPQTMEASSAAPFLPRRVLCPGEPVGRLPLNHAPRPSKSRP